MSETRQRILDTARKLFNAQGLQKVGVRAIAKKAKMSPGNLAYHFATKDDLVAAIVLELHERNQQMIFSELPADFSLLALYQAATLAMRNMLGYRFVLLSYVSAVAASPKLKRLETDLAKKRWQRHEEMLRLLIENGDIEREALLRSELIFEQSAMISSGWIQAATLRGLSDERAILHFAKLGCALLEPHCTKKGARDMKKILTGAYDEDCLGMHR